MIASLINGNLNCPICSHNHRVAKQEQVDVPDKECWCPGQALQRAGGQRGTVGHIPYGAWAVEKCYRALDPWILCSKAKLLESKTVGAIYRSGIKLPVTASQWICMWEADREGLLFRWSRDTTTILSTRWLIAITWPQGCATARILRTGPKFHSFYSIPSLKGQWISRNLKNTCPPPSCSKWKETRNSQALVSVFKTFYKTPLRVFWMFLETFFFFFLLFIWLKQTLRLGFN